MRWTAVACLLLGLAADAGANGRPAATSTIHFRQTHESDVIAGMTFGVLLSHDSGATWQWMCESAVGYGGMYDPAYEWLETGSIFATTFNGLTELKSPPDGDGCTFSATPPGMTFVTSLALGPDHALYYGAGDMNDSSIYKSIDDGASFPVSALPGMLGDSWNSLTVAPSDPSRIYAAGFRFVKRCHTRTFGDGAVCKTNADCDAHGSCENSKEFLLYQSVNGGMSYAPMSQTGLTFDPAGQSLISIVGVDPTNADTVYAKVTLEDASSGDGIFKSTNAGASWTKIFEVLDAVSFLVRSNGQLVAASITMGTSVSTNGGTMWTPLSKAPHIGCLAENSAGEVWACTENYGAGGIPSDGFGIMKSTDLMSWTGVSKFQNIQQPVDCPAGTVQHDQCVLPYQGEASVWCCLATQLGITSTPIDCTQGPMTCAGVASGDGMPDSGATMPPVTAPKGCCDTGDGGGPGLAVLALAVGAILVRRRRTM